MHYESTFNYLCSQSSRWSSQHVNRFKHGACTLYEAAYVNPHATLSPLCFSTCPLVNGERREEANLYLRSRQQTAKQLAASHDHGHSQTVHVPRQYAVQYESDGAVTEHCQL